MSRIFSALVIANVLLFLLTAGAGAAKYLDRGISIDRHVLLAVMTLLLSCLVQVTAFTYLTVTGKVISQAVHVGKLGDEAIFSAKSLKRRFTHQLALQFAGIVVATASGASAWRAGAPSVFHAAAAFIIVTFHALSWRLEWRILRANEALLETTLATYNGNRFGDIDQ